MGTAALHLNSTDTIAALGSAMVIPVLSTVPTLAGFTPLAGPAATLVPLSDLKTFFQGGTASEFLSTTAIATPAALTATTFIGFASTVSGGVLMGYGTTGDVTLKNRAGNDAFWITPNALTVNVADAILVNGTASSPAGTVRYVGSAGGTAIDLYNNVPTGGGFGSRINGVTFHLINATGLAIGAAGAAFAISGKTTALTADAASGAITFNANVGTGAASVGGYVFKVPVTHGSDSVAQTLTTALTLGSGGGARVQVSVGLGIAKAATATSTLSISGLPTSSAGLVSGDVWSNVGILTIVA